MPIFCFNNIILELEKDLGVNVDLELKFSKHIEIQVNKANKILGLIRGSYEYNVFNT